MRSEIIRCDVCKKEHDAQYKLPFEWIATTQNTRNDQEVGHHFCGKPCLAKWATGTPMSAGDQVMFGGPLL